MNNLQYYLKKFENAVAVLFIGILATGYLAVSMVTPKFKQMLDIFIHIHKQESVISETNRNIEAAKTREVEQQAGAQKDLKSFYRPIETGADAETIMAQEIGDILAILERDKVKTRAIKYTYEPLDDLFIKTASVKYSACRLDIDLIADYRTFLKFMRDLYKHQYFININKVEIVPYRKDKKILLVNLVITLYAQKASPLDSGIKL